MKLTNYTKSLFCAALACLPAMAGAQAVHPLAFGATALSTRTNWYKDYAEVRLQVNSPSAVAGNKAYTAANDGSGSADVWGGLVSSSPIAHVPAILPTDGDSLATSALTAGSFSGKIALIWRGGVQFGTKALHAQNAGASACVIINSVPGAAPIAMTAGTDGGSVSIPVYMISYEDGLALDRQLHTGASVYMTITAWGANYSNDLGILPYGGAGWHDYAIPYNQLSYTAGSPFAYKGADGAFVANFGSNTATDAALNTSVTFTPDGSAASTLIHSSAALSPVNFTRADSIRAFFSLSTYDITLPAGATTGRYDINYTISSDSTDENPADNTYTTSFYTTNDVYSKGRYDFVNSKPVFSRYEKPTTSIFPEYLWGPVYYVANGGAPLTSVQYSVFNPSATLLEPITVYVFKWIDGYNDAADFYTYPQDSVVETGELQLVAAGYNNFSSGAPGDTSGGVITQPIYTDTADFMGTAPYILDSNSWYYIAVDLPSGYFMGCDGQLSAYQRIYTRYKINSGYLEYSSIERGGSRSDMFSSSIFGNSPVPFGDTYYINSVDSFKYSSLKGIIPSVSMISHMHTTGGNTIPASIGKVSVFPNPAADYINVSVALETEAKTLSYTILNTAGQIVKKAVHNNVLNESYEINTADMAAGNYFIVIAGNDKVAFKKFALIK